MEDLLVFLLKKGAHNKPVRISTTEIGKLLCMSQQNASKKLTDLEKKGKITRTKEGIIITAEGLRETREFYSMLKGALEGERLRITGTIMQGLGEGGFYVSLEGYQKQFEKKLGFRAYPGTLNLRLSKPDVEKRHRLREIDPIIIEGWKEKNRSYGDIFAYKCRIEKENGALIIPVRTHHGFDILELIAPFNIKKKLGKKDGEKLTAEVI